MFSTSGCKNIGIRKFECVAKMISVSTNSQSLKISKAYTVRLNRYRYLKLEF